MGRKYGKKEILNAFSNLRKYNENFSITADIIVGFPGETEEDFQELIDFIKNNRILKVHGFRFSPRPNTKAKRLDKQIPGNIKKERNKSLFKISEYSSNSYLKNMLNKKVRVLIEKDKKGYDEYYIKHKVDIENVKENIFKEVIIKHINTEGVVSDVF
jgi:threonylcarbamoyladenosine tRNA methylthiotransferase MtaB